MNVVSLIPQTNLSRSMSSSIVPNLQRSDSLRSPATNCATFSPSCRLLLLNLNLSAITLGSGKNGVLKPRRFIFYPILPVSWVAIGLEPIHRFCLHKRLAGCPLLLSSCIFDLVRFEILIEGPSVLSSGFHRLTKFSLVPLSRHIVK